MATTLDDVLHDLTAEFERLESILGGLSDAQWQVRSGAPIQGPHDTLQKARLLPTGNSKELKKSTWGE